MPNHVVIKTYVQFVNLLCEFVDIQRDSNRCIRFNVKIIHGMNNIGPGYDILSYSKERDPEPKQLISKPSCK